MMNTVKGVGKNVEAAIEDALTQLGATQDQVTIKIISEGGLFKKAQVEVTLDELEKTGKVVSFDEQEPVEAEAPVKKEKKQKAKVEIKELEEPKKSGTKEAAEKATAKATTKKETAPAPAKTAEKATAQNKQERKAGVDDKTAQKILTDVINEILKHVKSEGLETKFSFDDRAIYVNITGEKLGALIGVGGETLNSIESYLNATGATAGINKRIRVDVGGYKQQKEDKLVKMAEKAYQIAVKSGKYKFDPMPARERRIIHTALQAHDDVTTYSKGNEPKRFVIVEKKK